ncbi:MAG: AAA family ATPase [Planctomycetaceae bacterium]|nr:AAA family ATPase [Planctomycetaceae bacterium]
MYGDYWQLDCLPFENNGDPQFFYRTPAHEAALLKLQYVIEQEKGAALLIGGHGLGKTYLTQVLEYELPETNRPVVRLMFPRLDGVQTLRLIARRLGAPINDHQTEVPPEQIIAHLEDRLRQLAEEGRSPVLIVDDAHLIESPEVLQSLALLMNASQVCGVSLSLVFVGQPELLRQVERVPSLNDRIAVRTALKPLSCDETSDYIRHRLRMAGLDSCMFNAEALRSFSTLAKGAPRKINQLCDLALLVGYADRLPTLTDAEVTAAAQELTCVSID